MRILVTGGLGFIGSSVIRKLISETNHEVINLDKVSYASTYGSVQQVSNDPRYQFIKCDLADPSATNEAIQSCKPQAVLHLAAESHVDRSIDGPGAFVEANIIGTFNLLQAVRSVELSKFVHVSTDEVFGSLSLDDPQFTEDTPYDPRSPYSASKAASDHLARAWGETFGVPVTVTNCSNNYGAFQFPEKMIPLMIIKAISGEPLPIYGRGENIRDWLYVEDHAAALIEVLLNGSVGSTYAIGGDNEKTNLDMVQLLCSIIDERRNSSKFSDSIVHNKPCEELIEFVEDRPGHDLRYAIDSSKIQNELSWKPTILPEFGLELTVDWYLQNSEWWQPLLEERSATKRAGTLGS